MLKQNVFKSYLDQVITANPGRIREVLELRRTIEPEIAALAAKRRDSQDMARLRRIVEGQHSGEGAGFAELDAKFHMAIAKATKNEVIWEMAAVLYDLLAESRAEPLVSPARRQCSLHGHERLLDALERADEQDARQAMREHLADVARQTLGQQD